MSYVTILSSILAVLGTLVVAVFVGTLLPGFERKYIQARLQQRIGPNFASPGLFSTIKFFFKKNLNINSPVPSLYKALPVVCFIAVFLVFLTLTPQNYEFLAFASLIAIIGFLKIDEIAYVLMGSLSKSVMSANMPFPDHVKGGARINTNVSFLEDISSNRSLRMIAFGSFPLYLSLFVPVALSGSIYLSDIVTMQQIQGPFLFTVSGAIGAIVFLIGYIIMLNEFPFNIVDAEADVIQGPYMEYAAGSRAFVYLTKGFLMFALASIFCVLYLGVAPNILSWGILINIIVAFIFPVIVGILSAFSPVFTYRQFYPVVIATSLLGVLAIVVGLF
jgi:energy-converting hydrogenase B subunit O